MARELLIRAWDKKDQKMIYPPNSCTSNLGPSITFDGRTYIDGVYQDLIYMLWTGLVDKNGDRIYEGDILGGLFESGYIGFCDRCMNLQYYANGECFACLGEVHWYEIVEENTKLEVIGNIYEHRSLML